MTHQKEKPVPHQNSEKNSQAFFPYGVQYEDDIDMKAILSVLWGKKLILFSSVLLFSLIGYGISSILTPIYKSEALLASANDTNSETQLSLLAGQFGGLANMAGLDIGGGSSNIDNAIAYLKSRSFAIKFIKDKNLMPQIFDKLWDKKSNTWRTGVTVPTIWDAYDLFSDARHVSKDSRSGHVTVAFEWKDPELAAQWVNEYVNSLNKYLKNSAIDETERNLNYLNKQLEKTSLVTVQKSLFSLIESEIKKSMLANVKDDFVFVVIDPAIPPRLKVWPNKLLITGIGLFIGLIVGFILVLITASRSAGKTK